MAKSEHTIHKSAGDFSENRRPIHQAVAGRHLAAFSLVEVTLAIGIMAFSFVAIFGLLPIGMGVFRKAIDTSVVAQIAQRLSNEIQEADWKTLVSTGWDPTQAQADAKSGKVTPNEIQFQDPTGKSTNIRYFDDQGNELPVSDKEKSIYHVHAVSYNPMFLPGKQAGGDYYSAYALRVVIEISNNPSHATGAANATTKLWTPQKGEVISQHATIVALNQWQKQ